MAEISADLPDPVPAGSDFETHISAALKRTQNEYRGSWSASAFRMLYDLSCMIRAEKVLETGVAAGWSSLAFLAALQRTHGTLVSIDLPYVGRSDLAQIGMAVPLELRANWKLYIEPDRSGIPKAISELGELDIVHYDSDKSYLGRKWAYPRLWKAVRPGGLFISDDITDNIAFVEFATEVDVDPIIVLEDDRYVGIIKK